MAYSVKKKLYIVTQHYPYGTGERTFIEPEIKYLLSSSKFEITIVSNFQQGERLTGNIDDRINVIALPAVKIFQKPIAAMRYFVEYWFDKKCQQERKEIFTVKEKRLGRFIKSVMCYIRANIFWKQIETSRIELDNSIIYTYWFHIQTLAFALNKNKMERCKLVSRIHGFDLHDERVAFGRQPFRSFMDEKVDKLYFIAEAGMNYYINKIGTKNIKKYQLYRLGTISKTNAEKKGDGTFVLVSCSMLIPLKRVNLLVEGLAQIQNIKIKWIHFGEGILKKDIERLAYDKLYSKKNVSYKFMGHKSNEEILSFYAQNKIDCFITASESEGCPVSIQEAMSFSIPIIATAVGEIPLMVEGNGLLLEKDLCAKDIAHAISELATYTPEQISDMREKSRILWERYFNGDRNFTAFVKELEKL